MKSISFDRAADIYDETRGFPAGIADQVADSAAGQFERGARLLELGVGTGRVAKPLLARGLRVTGIDLSPKMMRRLLETLPPGGLRPDLLQADAARLPLASGRFDGVISVHVFHLIAQWRSALVELRRVLKPEGILLTGYEWRPADSAAALMLKQWREILRAHGLAGREPGARDFEDVKAALLDLGAAADEWTVGEWTSTRSIAQHIETIEHRTWSSTWEVPDDFFPSCLAELRTWATREYGSPDSQFTSPRKFIWQKFRWTANADH